MAFQKHPRRGLSRTRGALIAVAVLATLIGLYAYYVATFIPAPVISSIDCQVLEPQPSAQSVLVQDGLVSLNQPENIYANVTAPLSITANSCSYVQVQTFYRVQGAIESTYTYTFTLDFRLSANSNLTADTPPGLTITGTDRLNGLFPYQDFFVYLNSVPVSTFFHNSTIITIPLPPADAPSATGGPLALQLMINSTAPLAIP